MDIALVTGADAGPGLAIARRLIGMGCRVYALATQFARNPFPHDDFIPLTCNLADPEALTKAAEEVVAREGHVSFVVHAARRIPTPLLDSPVATLAERINVGLLAPIVLARVTLPWLRKEQGHFLVICWNGDGPAPGGPVTAAIEGGLHHFADQLFEELRNDGVRATTIYAQPNAETSPEAALALDPQSAVNPEIVADAVEHLLRLRPSNTISTLVIRPCASAETPRLARSTELVGITTRDVQLPPRQNFPSESESIPTPTRQRPADAPPPSADDFEDEDEDDEWDAANEPLPWTQGREGPGGDSRQSGDQGGQPRQPSDQQGPRGYDPDRGHGGQGGGQARGRGRRRRGRGRGRGPEQPYRGDRPPAGGQQRPPQDGGRAPEQAPVDRPEYPDPEQEAEDRSFARDDSFRTPHSESEEEPDEGTSFLGDEARDEAPSEREASPDQEGAPVSAEARQSDASREREFANQPRDPRDEPDRRDSGDSRDFPDRRPPPDRREGDNRRGSGQRRDFDNRREPQRRDFDDRRDSQDRRGPSNQDRPPQQNQNRAQEGQGGGNRPPQQSHGPRRHRGYGRRPPPGGGSGRGPED